MALSELGQLIFLDRYAAKDHDHNHLEAGQRVVVCPDTKVSKRYLGRLVSVSSEAQKVVVQLEPTEEVLTLPWEQVDLPVEDFQAGCSRVASAVAAAEGDPFPWRDKFNERLVSQRFVPAGRIWAGAGVQEFLTPYNCVSGDTLVHTEDGVWPIKHLEGKVARVLSRGGVFRPAEFACYGEQELFAVTFVNGDVIHATAEHEWLVAGRRKDELRTVKTLDLEGLSVPLNPASLEVGGPDYAEGIRHGIVFGDGTITSAHKSRVDLFGPKKELRRWFESDERFEVTEKEDGRVHVTGCKAEWKDLPDSRLSPSYLRGFISGLIATDGYVEKTGVVAITQSSLETLRGLAKRAPRAGLVVGPPKVLRGKGSNFGEDYDPCYVVRIRRCFVNGFDLLRSDHKRLFVAKKKTGRGHTVQVRSVKATGRVEKVYCCVEGETHTMTIGRGYLTKQCFVLPAPHDSRSGIIETLNHLTEIMSRGGGVGVPLMSLRPKYSYVKGVNGRSSGSVCWSELYAFATTLIEQGGSRQGALMLMHYDWHPDILDFIDAKREGGRLEGANLSVAVSDEFMEAVTRDEDWNLIFPETDHPAYDTEWDGDIYKWKGKGYPVRVVRTLKAAELWDRIVHAAHASAEPGLFFVGRYNRMSNSYYYEKGIIYCSNPCGEQGIPPWSVCNLGHLNLARHLTGSGMREPADVDWDGLLETIRLGVRFLDDVIDIARVPFPQQAEQQQSERRIGLGTMGLGEMLIRCHIRYGANPECLEFLDSLYKFICVNAYETSVQLAKEKGMFPACDPAKLVESGFIKTLPESLQLQIAENGMRNVTALSQAPTGTVGTMMDTSTGMEAYPWLEWEREGRLGRHKEMAAPLRDWLAAGNLQLDLPDWFVSAMDMTPEDHAETQAAIQRWVDSSISKTSNLPHTYTVFQVDQFYRRMYYLGCKGGTVYRDLSRDKQVLHKVETVQATPEVHPIPKDTYSMRAVSVQTSVGKLNVKLGYDPETDEPFEVWLDVSRSGTIMAADREAIARLISLLLRVDSHVTPTRRVQLVIDQLQGIQGGDPAGFGPEKVFSVPDAVAKALERLLVAAGCGCEASGPPSLRPPDICPECHSATLYRAGGCEECASCGYSKC